MLKRMWGTGKTPPLLVEVQTGTASLNHSMKISQKIRQQTTLNSAIPLLCLHMKDVQPYHKDMCSTVFTAELFCHR